MPSVVTTVNTTYATPKTWSANEGLTASLLNTYIRDQVLALKSPAHFRCYIDEAADYTTTSTSFVDIDATDLSATVTTGGGKMLLFFTGTVYQSATTARVYLDISVDGTRLGLDDGLTVVRVSSMPSHAGVAIAALSGTLSAGSHTFKLQWKVDSGTGGMYAGAGTATADLHPTFWGVELA